jgi:hypothetical protein
MALEQNTVRKTRRRDQLGAAGDFMGEGKRACCPELAELLA